MFGPLKRGHIDLEQHNRFQVGDEQNLFDHPGKPKYIPDGDGFFEEGSRADQIEQAPAPPVEIEAVKGNRRGILALQEGLFGDIERFANPVHERLAGKAVHRLLHAFGIGLFSFGDFLGRAQNGFIADRYILLVELILLVRLVILRTGGQ